MISGEAPSRASDVFALGATLHRALTGNGLYGDLPTGNAILAIRRVMSRPPAISSNLDTATRAVISRAIRQDNAARPPTALELADRIEALDR